MEDVISELLKKVKRPERDCTDLVATFEGLKGTYSLQVLEKSFGFLRQQRI